MTTSTWTCGNSGIRVSFMPGYGPPAAGLPRDWERAGDGELRCLLCTRQHVAEMALAEAGLAPFDAGASEGKARALVAFERERDPDQTPKQIARVAGVSAVKVGLILKDLRRAGGGAA